MLSQAAAPILRGAENAHILSLSPPLNLDPKWLGAHTGYTLAKYGMTMVTLGFAAEFAKDGIAANTLWPRTTIATAAIKNILGGDKLMRMSRTPDIVADAAHLVFSQPAQTFSGHFLIDDTFLHDAGGVTEFDRYRVDPTMPLAPDFFVPADSKPPPGVKIARVSELA